MEKHKTTEIIYIDVCIFLVYIALKIKNIFYVGQSLKFGDAP